MDRDAAFLEPPNRKPKSPANPHSDSPGMRVSWRSRKPGNFETGPRWTGIAFCSLFGHACNQIWRFPRADEPKCRVFRTAQQIA